MHSTLDVVFLVRLFALFLAEGVKKLEEKETLRKIIVCYLVLFSRTRAALLVYFRPRPGRLRGVETRAFLEQGLLLNPPALLG